jgi:hypothetical protein
MDRDLAQRGAAYQNSTEGRKAVECKRFTKYMDQLGRGKLVPTAQ